MSRAAAPALLVALLVAAVTVPTAAASPSPAPAPPATAAPAASPLSILDLEGVKKSMRQSRGRVLLVHFWATWCLPCLDELPILSKFAAEMKGQGLDVLSLSLDKPDTGASRVKRLLTEQAPHLTPVIAKVGDPDRFIGFFDSRWEGAIPALFAFDPKGKLARSHVGEATRPDLDHLVADLLKARAAKKK